MLLQDAIWIFVVTITGTVVHAIVCAVVDIAIRTVVNTVIRAVVNVVTITGAVVHTIVYAVVDVAIRIVLNAATCAIVHALFLVGVLSSGHDGPKVLMPGLIFVNHVAVVVEVQRVAGRSAVPFLQGRRSLGRRGAKD
jgi:hypothetical protein